MKPEDFMFQYEGNQKEILDYFHHMFTEELGLTCKMRWKLPFYFLNSWILYLNPTKNNTVEIAYVRGNELSNANGLMDFKNRKQIMTTEIKDLKSMPIEGILDNLQEALMIDETVPYNVRKKQNKFNK